MSRRMEGEALDLVPHGDVWTTEGGGRGRQRFEQTHVEA